MTCLNRSLLLLPLMLIASSQAFSENSISQFSAPLFGATEHKKLVGETAYTLSDIQGRTAIKAISRQSASGLIFKQKTDLTQTPYLNWSWLIKNTLSNTQEQSKAGDDFPARLTVIISTGSMIWQKIALTYVWSSHQQAGAQWDNPYAASNIKMLALKGSTDDTNTWYTEKRNVLDDLIQAFGDKGSAKANIKRYGQIDAIVIMSDTDNTLSQAESYFGEIFVSEQ